MQSAETYWAEYLESTRDASLIEFKIDMTLRTYGALQVYGHQPAVYALAMPYMNIEGILGREIVSTEDFRESDYQICMESIGGVFKAIGRFIMKILTAIGNFFKKIWNAIFGGKKALETAVEKQQKINAKYKDEVPLVEKGSEVQVWDPNALLAATIYLGENAYVSGFNGAVNMIEEIIHGLTKFKDGGDSVEGKINALRDHLDKMHAARSKQKETMKDMPKVSLSKVDWSIMSKLTNKEAHICKVIESMENTMTKTNELIERFKKRIAPWETGNTGSDIKDFFTGPEASARLKKHHRACMDHIKILEEFCKTLGFILNDDKNVGLRCKEVYDTRIKYSNFHKD